MKLKIAGQEETDKTVTLSLTGPDDDGDVYLCAQCGDGPKAKILYIEARSGKIIRCTQDWRALKDMGFQIEEDSKKIVVR